MEYPIAPGQVAASGCKLLLGASGSEWLQVAAQAAASGSSGCKWEPKNTSCVLNESFYTQKLLHTDAFTQRRFYTQTLLHTEAFTHGSFYAQNVFLHTDTVTPRRFYTQKLLHTSAFTHRSFYTQTLLHTTTFSHTDFYTPTSLRATGLPRTPKNRNFTSVFDTTQEQARGAWNKLEFGSSSTSFGRKGTEVSWHLSHTCQLLLNIFYKRF